MKKLLGVVCVVLLAAAMPAFANTTLDFEVGSGSLSHPITSYGGFTWSNMGTINGPSYCSGACGYTNGTTSGSRVGFNGFGAPMSMTSGSAFNLVSGNFTGAWNNGLNVTVNGWLGSTLLYTTTFSTTSYSPTFHIFNFNGIDKAEFITFGGTSAGYSGGGTHVAVDDLTVGSSVPEPATLALMGTGMSMLGYFRRRR